MTVHLMNPRSSTEKPQRFSLRQREKDERRRRILRSAELAFGSKGYHAASLTEIAGRAELAVGTIYLYFEDKSDLYGSLILSKMEEIVETMDQALQSLPSPADSLRAAVHAQFAFHDANRRFFEIFLHQHQLQGSPLHPQHWEKLEALKYQNLALIEECLTRGQAAGEIRPGPARLYAVAFLGMVLQMIRQWIRGAEETQLIDYADFTADCFLQGAVNRKE